MLRIGTILRGTYKIEKHLSSGGFGNTYIATHIEFEECFAIKEFFMKGVTQRDRNQMTVSVSNSENQSSFQEQKEKFKKEARRIRKLDNPYIIKVHDLFEENGTAYYVMDFVDGENLAERLKRTGRPLTEEEVNKLLPQILDALKTIHDNGLQHLDLKPANIMVDKEGSIKLIDFGASKQLRPDGGATSSTALCYTPGYAPREQMEQSMDKFGPWTDIYALGATLYNMLTNNKPPMPSDIDDYGERVFSFPTSVSNDMRSQVMWMMQPNRMNRPQSIVEILSNTNEETLISQPLNQGFVISEESPKLLLENQRKQKTSILKWIRVNKYFVASLFLFALISFLLLWGLNRNDSSSHSSTIPIEDSTVVEPPLEKGVFSQRINTSLGECLYTGELDEEGLPNGNGTFEFTDGRYYEGNCTHGVFEGEAYFKYDNGDEFEGTFKNNSFSIGKYRIKGDGSYFEGTFKNGQPDKGRWYDKAGHLIDE